MNFYVDRGDAPDGKEALPRRAMKPEGEKNRNVENNRPRPGFIARPSFIAQNGSLRITPRITRQ